MTRRLPAVLRVLVGVGILIALVHRLGSDPVVEGLRSVTSGSALAALGLGLLTTVLSAYRWCLVARGLGLRLSLRAAVADCYRSVFLNSVLPGGVLGDVHRGLRHGRRAQDVGRGVRAVALERCAGLVVAVTVGGAVLLARPEPLAAAVGHLAPGRGVVVGLVAVAAVLAAGGAWTARGAGTGRIRAALRTGLADARAGVLSRRTWPAMVLLSVAVLAGYLALFVIAARAAGSRAGLGELLPLLVPAWLAMALPFSLGGWGPREAAAAITFGAGGLGASQGFTVAVVYGVLSLIACLPGGVVLLRRSGQPVPAPGGASPAPAVRSAARSGRARRA